MTFGRGRLDFNGYWEYPCPACARAFERLYPESVPCWPFEECACEGFDPNATVDAVMGIDNCESMD
jgi:hypothetical protein